MLTKRIYLRGGIWYSKYVLFSPKRKMINYIMQKEERRADIYRDYKEGQVHFAFGFLREKGLYHHLNEASKIRDMKGSIEENAVLFKATLVHGV